ncbi:hypothetical protein JJE66_05390 [Bradyrhizobium diazoefficiens]|uniref:hypothetical protein n=1 Tax=Bradyrhizobium diazoefficiens TaxID=1355477 RepID=UPI00190A9D13|nr:hypothetical protein [Bradyrhizobium diazoefficiens]MBK3660686.1 hypothetical protein [Bradyrhizobium diazoefficiens]
MDDDVGRRQELRLIKAFLSITDPYERQRILNLAEQLADDAAWDATGHAGGSTADACRDVPDRIE